MKYISFTTTNTTSYTIDSPCAEFVIQYLAKINWLFTSHLKKLKDIFILIKTFITQNHIPLNKNYLRNLVTLVLSK